MDRKKLSEVKLKRSVLKNLTGEKCQMTGIKKAGVADDCARLLLRDYEDTSEILTASGLAIQDSPYFIKAALTKLYNNIKVSGGIPLMVMDTLMLPEEDEAILKTVIKELKQESEALGMLVAGGHTEITTGITVPAVALNIIGISNMDNVLDISRAALGMDIVMTGYAGALGTFLLTMTNIKSLLSRYSEDYIRGAKYMEHYIRLKDEAVIAAANGAVAAHDISTDGVYGALWELADGAGTGIEICHDYIPVRQETIEVCEFMGVNPYMIDGSGGALFVCSDGIKVKKALQEAGYEAELIGKTTATRDRVIIHDDERRFLTPPRG